VRHGKALGALALALITLSACASSDGGARRFAEPPNDSYSASMFQVTIDGNTEPLDGATVSHDFFKAADVRPLIGRFFVDDEYRMKTRSVVVLNHAFWQGRLHGAPQVIGSALTVDGHRMTVVGVAERGFAVPKGAQVWLPRIEP
jgi:hypothetical protein